jgi:hypothetical protein
MENTSSDIMNYWLDRTEYKETYELALAAIGLMSINPSEAAVERSFSAMKLIHNNLRNRLSSESVIATMFIKINIPLLENSTNTVWLDELYSEKYEVDNEVFEVPID